jgi:hypothetical protein
MFVIYVNRMFIFLKMFYRIYYEYGIYRRRKLIRGLHTYISKSRAFNNIKVVREKVWESALEES